jgi:hypothetical protein
MKEIKAPNPFTDERKTVFLAGSIEMDKAENWQIKVIHSLKNSGFCFLNPRRDSWDSTWKQDKSFLPFREQVEWELSALDYSEIILMYFDPATYSPVSLMELGLYAAGGKLRVCCPDGFWRKGNVEIVCEKYNIPFFHDLQSMIDSIRE